MTQKIKDNVYWVGVTDWGIKHFHGHEYSTHRGTSYNSYLIKEDKNVLIDTVWHPFADRFLDNLRREINLEDIDYIVMNHGETDHSGALPELMKLIPDTPIYCTAAGKESLQGHYHSVWDFRIVKTGDRLDIGNGKELLFIETPMLHWPDSMFTYLSSDNVLFSNDAFGQHYAHGSIFDDQADPCELWAEAIKYYANILTPFSALVLQKITQFEKLGLPLDVICPSHGMVWRSQPSAIINKYKAWADAYSEDLSVVAFATMWNGTQTMADQIATGLRESKPDTDIMLINLATSDLSDAITSIFRARMVLVGSPTINRGVMHPIAGLLEALKGLRFKGKLAAAFGSYGWSGEAPGAIEKTLADSGFKIIAPHLKILWQPDAASRTICLEYGIELGKILA